jgi:hypothetical protein
MSKIASPLTLDLTTTRAFKTWLYQLWLSTGGTTNSSLDDIDIYLPTNNQNNSEQSDQFLLVQIRDELEEINKKLDEMQINERTVLEDVNRKFDDVIILLGASL